jgi:hypothetical protein
MSELQDAARQASLDDYRFGKPPMEEALDGLTMGEIHRYYTKACQTVGAIYSSKVKPDAITMTVTLPPMLALVGMTEEEAAGHERYLHNEMEKAIVWIIRWHKIKRGELAL